MNRIQSRAFTLIELLIVVAIIAILAAIAVPNFLEAQTRSKVSRTKADMRTMATALEAYAVDYNTYPACHRFGIVLRRPNTGEPEVLERLSTPIAYLSSTLTRDPFTIVSRVGLGTAALTVAQTPIPVNPATDAVAQFNSYIYQSWGMDGRSQTEADFTFVQVPFTKAGGYLLHSAGPDGVYHNLGGIIANEYEIDGPINLMYDPTNGTISFGSVYRSGGSPTPGIQNPTTSPTPYAGGEGILKAIAATQ